MWEAKPEVTVVLSVWSKRSSGGVDTAAHWGDGGWWEVICRRRGRVGAGGVQLAEKGGEGRRFGSGWAVRRMGWRPLSTERRGHVLWDEDGRTLLGLGDIVVVDTELGRSAMCCQRGGCVSCGRRGCRTGAEPKPMEEVWNTEALTARGM